MVKRLPMPVFIAAALAGCVGAGDAPDTAEAAVADVMVLTGARLIDGTGGAPVEDAVLVIRGERVEDVGPAGSVDVPDGAEIVDLSGKTIMPAMISIHNHLALTHELENSARHFNEANIRDKLDQYARYGVLHVTSMGTDKPLVHEIRQRQRDGQFPGARLYTAGRGFGVVGGYPPLQPDATDELDVHRLTAPDQAPDAVSEVARHEVDFIKLWVDHHFQTLPSFSPDIYARIIEEAQRHGVRTVAHIHTLEDAHGVIDAGIDGLVHSVRDEPVDAALIEKMTGRGIFSVSTLVREESMFIYAERPPYLDDDFFTAYVPAVVTETLASPEYQAQHLDNPELDEWPPALRMAQQNLKTLFDAGVKIGFGSDSGPPARFEGYFEHRELELMVEAGLTPAQVIEIASKDSAEILQIDEDYGTIEPGKMAEFLVLGSNPLDNISNTRSLEEVWQDGRRIHTLR